MNLALPRIAIPEPTSTDTAYNQRSLPQYIHAVMAAGGIAVPIPLHEPAEARSETVVGNSCSAVLLPGSPCGCRPGSDMGQRAHQANRCSGCGARGHGLVCCCERAFEQLAKPLLGNLLRVAVTERLGGAGR